MFPRTQTIELVDRIKPLHKDAVTHNVSLESPIVLNNNPYGHVEVVGKSWLGWTPTPSGMLHVFEVSQPGRVSLLQGRLVRSADTLSETASRMVKLVREMRRMKWELFNRGVANVLELPEAERPTTIIVFLDVPSPDSAGPHSNNGIDTHRILNAVFEIESAGRAVGMHLIRSTPQQKGTLCPRNTSPRLLAFSPTARPFSTNRSLTGT